MYLFFSICLFSVYFTDPNKNQEGTWEGFPAPHLSKSPATYTRMPSFCPQTRTLKEESQTPVNRGRIQALIFNHTLRRP